MSRLFLSMALAAALAVAGPGAGWAAGEEMDHAALAAQYEQEAKEARAKAQYHRDMEKRYDRIQVTKGGQPKVMAGHCKRLIAEYEQIAENAEALAKEHRAAAAAE